MPAEKFVKDIEIKKVSGKIRKIKKESKIEKAWVAWQPYFDGIDWPRGKGKRAAAGAVICLEARRKKSGKLKRISIPVVSFFREDLPRLGEGEKNISADPAISAVNCAIICVMARTNDFLAEEGLEPSYKRLLEREGRAAFKYVTRFNRGNSSGLRIKMEGNSIKIEKKRGIGIISA